MRVGVYINGTENGLDSASAGEGRFAYNLAHMLAVHGHEVLAFGSTGSAIAAPSWGPQTPIPGIHMMNYKEMFTQSMDALINLPHDVCIDNVWTKCSELKLDANVICHNTFSWDSNISNYYTHINKCIDTNLRHLITTPYPKIVTDKIGEKYLRWLPFPYYKEFSDININNRNQITWACKDVFTDEWPKDMDIHTYGVLALKAIKKVSDTYNLTANFITSRTFSSNRAQRLGATEVFSQIKSKQLTDYVATFSKCLSYLDRSRATIIMPNYAGSCFNAISSGSISVFANRTPFSKMLCGKDEELFIADTESKLLLLLDKIYNDNTFYLELLAIQGKHVMDYSYESSHNQWMKIYQEFTR